MARGKPYRNVGSCTAACRASGSKRDFLQLSSFAWIAVCSNPCRIPFSTSAGHKIPPCDPYAMSRPRYAIDEDVERKLGDERLNVHQLRRSIRLEKIPASRNLQERARRPVGHGHAHLPHVIDDAAQAALSML